MLENIEKYAGNGTFKKANFDPMSKTNFCVVYLPAWLTDFKLTIRVLYFSIVCYSKICLFVTLAVGPDFCPNLRNIFVW